MTGIMWVLLGLGAVVLLSLVVSVVIARMLYKRMRRSRAVTGAALRTRAGLARGPRRAVLNQRLRLRATLDSGRAAIEIALQGTGPRGELPRLFYRIQSEGAALDTHLVLLLSETDAAVLADELPVVRRRVDDVAELVRRLRTTVAGGLGDLTDDNLTALRSEVDREAAAVTAGLRELHALNGHDHPRPSFRLARENRS